MTQYYVHFTDESFASQLSPYRLNERVKALDLDYRLFQRLIEIKAAGGLENEDPRALKINNEQDSKMEAHKVETKGILEQLFSRFIEGQNIRFYEQNKDISEALVYIHQNFNRGISVQDVSRYLKLNTDYFGRLFKSVIGVPPSEYLLKVRLEKAQELLVTTRNNLEEICYEIGMNSRTYFSSIFKSKIGYSPKDYRQMEQIKKR